MLYQFFSRFPRKFRSMTILAVDDDKDDLDLLSEAIREVSPDFDFVTAHNGVEALALLNSDFFDLPAYIFLDINMPLMDGLACLGRGKAGFCLFD